MIPFISQKRQKRQKGQSNRMTVSTFLTLSAGLSVHFFKQYRYFGMIVCCLFIGCSRNETNGLPDGENVDGISELLVRIAPQEHVDSAQLFFFRKAGDSDTLVSRQIVYDIAYFEPHSFRIELPAGKYTMVVFGNVPTDYIVANPPYSRTDIYIDYNGGRRPSEIYYGNGSIDVGKDTASLGGMVALSSFVNLTIRDVPEGISRMIVRLLNTAAGLTITYGYLKNAADPPLADTLNDIRADSSYVVDFYCFPGGGTDGRSTLEVKCYDDADRLVYSGKSEPFLARPGYDLSVGCSFSTTAVRNKNAGSSQEISYFDIKEI